MGSEIIVNNVQNAEVDAVVIRRSLEQIRATRIARAEDRAIGVTNVKFF